MPAQRGLDPQGIAGATAFSHLDTALATRVTALAADYRAGVARLEVVPERWVQAVAVQDSKGGRLVEPDPALRLRESSRAQKALIVVGNSIGMAGPFAGEIEPAILDAIRTLLRRVGR